MKSAFFDRKLSAAKKQNATFYFWL